jgi:hypothetical protein
MKIWNYNLRGLSRKLYPMLRHMGLDMQEKFREELLAKIKERAVEKFGPRETFSRNIAISLNGDGVQITFMNNVAYFQEVGTKPHQMTKLIGKTVPIYDKVTGRKSMRKVTLKSIIMGGWKHPGTPGANIVEGALDEIDEMLGGIELNHILEKANI